MEALPIIYHKHSGAQIKLIEFSDSNSVDNPAYCEVSEQREQIDFIFPGSEEEQKEISINGLQLSFGVNSGRIYRVSGLKQSIDDSTKLALIESIGSGTNNGIRSKANAVFYSQMISIILEH